MAVGEAGFAGRTVVVTGATAGVGRAVVMRFARAGARLGLIARGEEALRDLEAALSRQGVQVATAAIDVADADAVFAAAARFEAALGPIALWVNDAMVTVFAPLGETTPEEFRRVTEVTYLGCVHGTMAALKHMRPHGAGRIVQVGSALAYRGIPLQAAYCGAKHAIRGFTASLRTELMHEESAIRVSIVELPAVNTPQFDWARTRMSHAPRPVPPVVQPEAAAAAIARAATEGGAEYWLGRSTPLVILGNMLVPGLVDRYLARTAYAAQQTVEPVLPGRRDNLDRPVPDLHRVRGTFGAESHGWAPLLPA
ncbi:MAG TPA: SDR family oxidoreductase, partial [Hyphomicrobiales bacterium]|nr:SDR family oxidoreductase [Hyphomicrobiales bacterium]